MGKITYDNKVKINELTDVPAINKVQDVDMNEIKTSVNTIYDALGLGTDTFSTSTSYVVGDMVIYNGTIYKCINATSGAWNPVDWSLVSFLSMIYPVGSIYMSVNSTDPSLLFGGTWEQLEDRFLLGASSTYSAGSTGGGATTGSASGNTGSTTLTINQMPAHTHRPSLYDAGLKTLVGGLNWTSPTSKLSGYWGTGATETGGYIERVGGGKGHTHTLNNHTHTNMPPYLAVYMWERIS